MRSYLIQPGLMGRAKERWGTRLEERMERSPLLAVMERDIGTASKLVHIWLYKSPDERLKIRKKAMTDGI